jgi:hypothetical protein
MRRASLLVLYAISLAVVGWLGWWGREYYELPLVERPRHPLHWELKPGGELGRAYGIAGASLMVGMLSYSVRKRVPFLRRVGRLGSWLDFHIWCGVIGPLLIVLHSALKVGGLIAIAFWSMVAVALSGILGRFLYAQIPRTAAGDQLSLEEARRLDSGLGSRLRDEFGLDERAIAALDPLRGVAGAEPALAGALVGMTLAPFRFRSHFTAFRRSYPGIPRARLAQLRRVASQRAQLLHRIRLWRRMHELFHYWHVFHKPFAVLMYLFAAIHIGVAYATGYAVGIG